MTKNLLDLSGMHIFVAGGSRGIGAAAARMAGGAGANVSLTYQSNRDAAEKTADTIPNSIIVQADVSDKASISNAISTAESKFGPLHGLVVSAGIFEGCPLEEMSEEFWDRTLDTNLKGTFLAVQAAVRSMRKRADRGGSIVIYTSTAGQRGSAIYSAYATSKGAQIMFMRSMALELAPDQIRVNCIAPAWTETDMAAPSLDKLGRDQLAANVPLGRIGLPEDVAGATCYLLSDLSQFVTGMTLTVDGGADMRG
ncbi:MAG TPA: SDR family NAD(P)-dependent oxidoreductase [Fimbriimonadaceae bacterium]|nr:SDR family NAD(P)-dependent oxidoreductase [Fimbriimonadaceae bacterium]